MIYRKYNHEVVINIKELTENGRDFLTKDEIKILEILLHKLKCQQEREKVNGNE